MYTTKPLSLFKGHPEAASWPPPPEGRNAGLLVVKGAVDEDNEHTCCWGTCCTMRVWELPFPQNRVLTVKYQDEIVRRARKPGWFTARAVAADGFPPSLYRSKYWEVYEFKQPKRNFDLSEALGLDATLRSRQLADDAFPVAATAAAVGKWYCPFFLVKEHGVAPREQMERSAFYEVVLEQRWEQMRGHALRSAHDRSKQASKKALIDGVVEAKLEGRSSRDVHAYLWFVAATGERVGVCTTVWERMLWEQSKGGWVDEEKVAGVS